MSKDINTEDKILAAAIKIFKESGVAGARMQAIADEAGVNKALLHYYFRSKNLLFKAVFRKMFDLFIPQAQLLFDAEIPLIDKLRMIVSAYMGFLMLNPFLPVTLLYELSQNPGFAKEHFLVSPKPDLSYFRSQVKKEIENGTIKSMDPDQLLLNTISLCVFPVIAKPLAIEILDTDSASYNKGLEKRADAVYDFLISAITPVKK